MENDVPETPDVRIDDDELDGAVDEPDYFRAEHDERTLDKRTKPAPRLRRVREGTKPEKRKTKGA